MTDPPATPQDQLDDAIRNLDPGGVRAALAEGADADHWNELSVLACTPILHLGILFEDLPPDIDLTPALEIWGLLVLHGAQIDDADDEDNAVLGGGHFTPTHDAWAAAMLDHGAEIDLPRARRLLWGSGPLTVARLLARTFAFDADDLNCALRDAALRDDSVSCRLLMDCGADPNARSARTGETALHPAARRAARRGPTTDIPLRFPTIRRSSGQTVTALLRAGADPRIQDDRGLEPLAHAVEHGRVGAALALLRAGGDPDRKMPNGETVLAFLRREPGRLRARAKRAPEPELHRLRRALAAIQPEADRWSRLRDGDRDWLEEAIGRLAPFMVNEAIWSGLPERSVSWSASALGQAVTRRRRDAVALKFGLLILDRLAEDDPGFDPDERGEYGQTLWTGFPWEELEERWVNALLDRGLRPGPNAGLVAGAAREPLFDRLLALGELEDPPGWRPIDWTGRVGYPVEPMISRRAEALEAAAQRANEPIVRRLLAQAPFPSAALEAALSRVLQGGKLHLPAPHAIFALLAPLTPDPPLWWTRYSHVLQSRP